MLPRALAGLAHDRQSLNLVATEAPIQDGRDRGQQVAYRIGHAADVRLLDGETVRGQASGQLGLAQGGAGFFFIELACLLDAQGALDERQAAAQLVLGEVSGQRDNLPACRPRSEQARYAEKALVFRLCPEFTQDRQPRVATVADDVVAFTGPPRDGRRRVEAALADGRLDFLVDRITLLARVVVIRAQLVQGHDHGCVGDRVTQGHGRWAVALEPGSEQLAGHVLGGHLSHCRFPALGTEPCCARHGRSAHGR